MAEKHLTDGTTALAAQPRVIKIEAAEKPQNAQLRVAAYHRPSDAGADSPAGGWAGLPRLPRHRAVRRARCGNHRGEQRHPPLPPASRAGAAGIH